MVSFPKFFLPMLAVGTSSSPPLLPPLSRLPPFPPLSRLPPLPPSPWRRRAVPAGAAQKHLVSGYTRPGAGRRSPSWGIEAAPSGVQTQPKKQGASCPSSTLRPPKSTPMALPIRADWRGPEINWPGSTQGTSQGGGTPADGALGSSLRSNKPKAATKPDLTDKTGLEPHDATTRLARANTEQLVLRDRTPSKA